MTKSWLLLGILTACSRSAPSSEPVAVPAGAAPLAAAPASAPPRIASATSPGVASAGAASAAPPSPPSSAEPGAVADAGPSSPSSPGAPALKDADGKALPQTETKPRVDSPFFQFQAQELFAAIVSDDPKRARSFFFPLTAYELVKDVQNPGRDWELRLIKAFERDVHDYHRKLGKRRAETRFLRLDVPEARAEWMKPGREGNRLGYYRVLRSRLVYADETGKERSLEVTSLISWRGEWYLVHLNGFE